MKTLHAKIIDWCVYPQVVSKRGSSGSVCAHNLNIQRPCAYLAKQLVLLPFIEAVNVHRTNYCKVLCAMTLKLKEMKADSEWWLIIQNLNTLKLLVALNAQLHSGDDQHINMMIIHLLLVKQFLPRKLHSKFSPVIIRKSSNLGRGNQVLRTSMKRGSSKYFLPNFLSCTLILIAKCSWVTYL